MAEDSCEYVCPLCCEELDISDREFYPCKCGYQVCMWCWHRIRESESGLCPACRTPYGQDPHQFKSADVQNILKHNKKEKKKLKEAVEVPKDRTQLANMRVIRRNLVYAVGLPNLSEEMLRKPEYFGQYGKISKIVLNRSNDPRRTNATSSSASAYVTFVHKEDTLACILALDGFYLEGRNIRASYGTSKYCSAFIKNVRCNNPECTYLHEMGAVDDTFTKQEIQAGYVTSGRDVLARQQQILEEQLRQGNTPNVIPRKRVGGGGPSGTGKACANPVFPVPEYEEPTKPSANYLVPTPPGVTRSVSTSAAALNPANIAAKLGRSASIGGGGGAGKSPTLGSSMAPASSTSVAVLRKSHSSGPPTTTTVAAAAAAASTTTTAAVTRTTTTTAASVVAGVRTTKSEAVAPDPHTTLTPLTPLKRTSKAALATTTATAASRSASMGAQLPSGAGAARGGEGGADGGSSSSSSGHEKLSPLRNGTNKKQQNGTTRNSSSNSSDVALTPPPRQDSASSVVSSIGGDLIGPPAPTRATSTHLAVSGIAGGPAAPAPAVDAAPVDSLGGQPFGINNFGAGTRSSALGGEVFTGPLLSRSNKSSAIGSTTSITTDKWDASGASSSLSTGPMLGSNTAGGGGAGTLWDGGGASSCGLAAVGGSVIGSSRAPGPASSAAMVPPSPGNNNSSSALASILGISLPTGSGSLQESSNLWTSSSSSSSSPSAPGPSALASLNSSAMPAQDTMGGVSLSANTSTSLIGGVPIGGGGGGGAPVNAPGAVGGGSSSNTSDIALLQSLLPGVHITTGNEPLGFEGGDRNSGWNNSASAGGPSNLGPGGLNGEAIGGNWDGRGAQAPAGSMIGTIGQNPVQQNQRRGPGIW